MNEIFNLSIEICKILFLLLSLIANIILISMLACILFDELVFGNKLKVLQRNIRDNKNLRKLLFNIVFVGALSNVFLSVINTFSVIEILKVFASEFVKVVFVFYLWNLKFFKSSVDEKQERI